MTESGFTAELTVDRLCKLTTVIRQERRTAIRMSDTNTSWKDKLTEVDGEQYFHMNANGNPLDIP